MTEQIKTLKNVEFILSDNDIAKIPARYIRFLKISNISDSVELKRNSNPPYQVLKIKKGIIKVTIDGDFVNYTKTADNYQKLDEEALIVNRLKYPDIINIRLNYQEPENKPYEIHPYWNSSDVVESMNTLQKYMYDDINSILSLSIGSNRNIKKPHAKKTNSKNKTDTDSAKKASN